MTLSLDGLLKYTINLIIPKRPTKWRCINTANTAFRSLVAGMKGYEEILQTAGYTEKEGTHIEFPEHIQEPDKTKLTILAAELLMAKLQVERMSSVPVSNTEPDVENLQDALVTLKLNAIKKKKMRKANIIHVHSKSSKCLRRRSKSDQDPYDREPIVVSSRLRTTGGSFSYDQKDNSATYNGSKFNFISPPSDTLICQQCSCLAYEPHQTQCCNSLFCKRCLNSDNMCPVCLTPESSIFDRRSDKLIQSLEVWCPNSIADGLGCEWLGELREVPDHRKECQREQVLCSYSLIGCNETMFRNKLKQHEIAHQWKHLNLAMKKVVSLTTTVQELQERVKQLDELQESVEQLKVSFEKFKEQSAMYD